MGRIVVFFLMFLALVAGALAQGAPSRTTAPAVASANDQNLTAQELAVNADQLFAAGKFAEALALYRKFIDSFGQSIEAQPAIRSMRYPMAMCLFHLKKFSEAVDAIEEAFQTTPPIDPWQRQELMFWKGVCLVQDEPAKARETFEQFLTLFPPNAERDPNYLRQYPAGYKIPEAKLLIGSCYLADDKFKECAEYLGTIKNTLIPVNRGRATVMELRALVEGEDLDGALKLVREEYPNMGDLMQLITFQTLTLQLGSIYLEKGDSRSALICLQRIWDSERLLRHQRDRLQDLESKLAVAQANSKDEPYTALLLGQLISNIRREIKNFEKIPNFDSALRMRVAYAFQKMERYRECALVLDAMLRDMPPDPVVESASVNVVQCWSVIDDWEKAVASADAFLEKFPDSKQVPFVLYLKGNAQEKQFRYDEAIAAYDEILKNHASGEYGPRALFMRGFTLLLADRSAEGGRDFEKFLREHPEHEMTDAAAYWHGMSFSLDKQFERARGVMGDYLAQRKDGAYRAGATYRRAYCAQQLEDYQTSIKELTAYLKEYPDDAEASEAKVLLADALMNEGRIDEGVARLKSIPSNIADQGLYEEAYFKIAKALKLQEEHEKYRAHNQAFIDINPRSLRVGEAIYNVGWVYRQQGEIDKARQTYWDAIEKYGNDADIHSIDELLPALAKLYKGEAGDNDAYFARLRDLALEAKKTGRKSLEMRALWAQSQALRKSDPDRSKQLLREAATLADVSKTNPLLLADFAELLVADGKDKEGEQMWRDLVKWNPRARQKDRALAAMGLLEMQRGDEKKALEYFDRFEKETMGSLMFGKIMLAKADLLALRGQNDESRKALDTLLANKFSSGQDKAQALYRMGEIYMKLGKPELAIPYYQKVYVMYGRWRDWVAKSYLRSGEAFEKISDKDAARRTYQELAENEDLSSFPETPKARERLNALGGPLPKAEPPAQG